MNRKAQGAMEYLLLLGVGIIIVAVILIILINTQAAGETDWNASFDFFRFGGLILNA